MLLSRFKKNTLCLCLLLVGVFGFGFTQDLRQDFDKGKCGDSSGLFAECVIDDIVGQENEKTGIIQTKLDNVDSNTGGFGGKEFKISDTLDSARLYLAPYMEWIAFLALSAAVALLIYNGLILVFTPLSPDQTGAVKKRIMYILAGTLLVTGFYFILKVLLSVILDIVRK